MSKQSAIFDLPDARISPAGAYAAGHLGELTRFIPCDLVDAVLAESRAVQRRVRMLPSRVGVYLLLAMALFEHVSMTGVWDKLTFAFGGRALANPSEAALRALRRRIGVAPLSLLFDTLAVPLAPPGLTGTCYRRWRTVAFDGCSSIKVPDHPRNCAWLGKVIHAVGPAGYPAVMLMTLVETGTRGMLGAVFGPACHGSWITPAGCLPGSTIGCWCCWTARSTATSSCGLSSAPARSSWPAPKPTAGPWLRPACPTART